MVAVAALFDTRAETQLTQTKVYIGGPRPLIAESVQQQGWAISLGAYTQLTAPLSVGAESAEITGGPYNSFPVLGGAFYAMGSDLEDNWFSYQFRRGTVLGGIQRISGVSTLIPTTIGGTPNYLNLWRDCSAFLTKGTISWRLQDSGFTWQLALSGRKWNSAIVFQEAAVRVYQRFWNSTYRVWSDYLPVFHGYFDPIRVSAGWQQNEFTATATGLSKYLQSVTIPAQTFGCEQIAATYSSSGILTNPDLAPDEGRPPVSFAEANLGDEDQLTVCVLKDIPNPGPALAVITGAPQAVPKVPKRNYVKIQQVACAARGGPRVTRQQQLWVEIVNANPVGAPSVWPWQDDPGTPSENPTLPDGTANPNYRPPTKAAIGEDEWGTVKGAGIEMRDWVLEVYPSGSRIYLESSQVLAPQANVIVCHDKKLYEENFRVPPGTTIIEMKNLDGWTPGMWMGEKRHGMGSTFSLDPRGGGLLLRGNPTGVKADGSNAPRNALIAADTATPANNWQGTITLETGAGANFPERGEGDIETVACTLRWNGKSGDTLLNVEKGGKDGNRTGGDTDMVDKRLNVSFFNGWYYDAVFWGNVTPPEEFHYETDTDARPQGPILNADGTPSGGSYPNDDADLGIDVDQNTDGFISQVWVNRPDATTITVTTVPGAVVSPAGIPENASIRRKRWGGGIGEPRDDDDETFTPFAGWDSGVAGDWEELATPLPGNPAGVNAIAYFMMELPLHPAATVVEDLTDVPQNDGYGTYYAKTIEVNENGAWEYPPALAGREYLIASPSNIAFKYGWRDRTTFYECQKLNAAGAVIPWGSGDTIPVSEELYRMVDLNPDWRANEGGPLTPRNLLQVAGLSWDHKKPKAVATVLYHDTSGAGSIDVQPGQANRFATSGTITVRNRAGTATATFTYSSRTNDTFNGVAWAGSDPAGVIGAAYQIPAGTSITGGAIANWPLNWSIHASRRDSPIAFNTNYGSNPDWQEIIGAGHSDRPGQLVDVVGTGHSSQWRWIVLVVWETSDDGHPALGHLIPWRQPKTAAGREASFRQMVLGGYSYGAIVNEILDQSGIVEGDRDVDLTGPLVRNLAVSAGNAWDILQDIARNAGYIVGEDSLGKIHFFPDPRRPGSKYAGHPKHTFDKHNVFGVVQREELPYSAVDQVHLVATNNYAQEVYDLVTPPQPIRYGGAPKLITGRFATSLQDATYQAQAELARGNGGQRLRIPGGHYTDIGPLDFVRVALPLDVNGQELDATMICTGCTWDFSVDGQTSIVEVSTFRK